MDDWKMSDSACTFWLGLGAGAIIIIILQSVMS